MKLFYDLWYQLDMPPGSGKPDQSWLRARNHRAVALRWTRRPQQSAGECDQEGSD